MNIELWLAFVVASSLLLIVPGPTILMVMSYSVSHGRRANLPLVAAVGLGDVTALSASLLGLGALMSTSAFWFTVVKVMGGLYLIYLGLRMFFGDAAPVSQDTSNQQPGRLKMFINTYLVTALNPKGLIFFIAFLPQFVSVHGEPLVQLWILGATFVSLAVVNTLLYAYFASSIRSSISSARAQKQIARFGGTLLTVAGCWALFSKRPT